MTTPSAYRRTPLRRRGIEGPGGLRSLHANTLNCIHEFYITIKDLINVLALNTQTINFVTGQETSISYPKAKIIDMYAFMKSR